MPSPARCTTASTPSRAPGDIDPASMSQRVSPGPVGTSPAAEGDRRTRRTTSWPAAGRYAASSEPMSPCDPLTRTLTAATVPSQLTDELVGLGHDPGARVEAQGPVVELQDPLGGGCLRHLSERRHRLEEHLGGRRHV